MSTPAASAARALGKSYAVTITIGSPRRFISDEARQRDRQAVGRRGGRDQARVRGHQRASSATVEQGRDGAVDVDDLVGVLARRGRRAARSAASSARLVLRVGDDDDRVAAVHEAGGGAVDLHRARAALAGDRVGLEARAVVDVDDVHLLVLEDVGGLEQVGIDRDRPDVVQVAVGHRRPVDLGLQHRSLHFQWLPVEVSARPSGRGGEQVVVDQPHVADARRDGDEHVARRPTRSTGVKVSGETSARYSGSTPAAVIAARASAAIAGASRSPRGDRLAGGLQRARQRQRALALAVAQAHVAARQRQPVGLADGRADLDPHGDVEVAHEPADDRDLLGVLLAEVRDVGPGDVEELRHDGRDAVEVRLPARRALQRRGDAGDADARREAGRVDRLGRAARTGRRRPPRVRGRRRGASSRG